MLHFDTYVGLPSESTIPVAFLGFWNFPQIFMQRKNDMTLIIFIDSYTTFGPSFYKKLDDFAGLLIQQKGYWSLDIIAMSSAKGAVMIIRSIVVDKLYRDGPSIHWRVLNKFQKTSYLF